MTDPRISEVLDRLDALEVKSSPAPWTAATAPHPESGETKREYLTNTLVGGDEPLWVVWTNDGSSDVDYVVPATTGDGPTSESNAVFVAATRTAMPVLVAVLREVQQIHAPKESAGRLVCAGCQTHVTFTPWPCPTVRAFAPLAEIGDQTP